MVKEAAARCEEEALWSELARLYATTGHAQLCIDAHRQLTRAFPQAKGHWEAYARFLFAQGQADEGGRCCRKR